MAYVWLTAGIICILYYLIIAFYAGPDADFSWFWIIPGAVFFLFYGRDRLMYIRPDIFPAALHHAAVAVVCTGLAIIGIFCIPVVRGMNLADPENADYIVVLGAQVKKTVPSRALKKRLDKAIQCAEKLPEARLILSGGQGSGEDISEAECMRRYLTEHGVSQDRLLLEDKSTTTRENLVFSDRLTGCSQKKCGILSNDFHVCRALKIARAEGYRDPCGIDAPGDAVMEVHYIVREASALIVWQLWHIRA